MDFGSENDGAGQDINGAMLAWFDCHLKGKRNEVAQWPTVRYFLLGSNEWRTASAWPPPEAESTPCYLHEQGRLTLRPPTTAEAPDCYQTIRWIPRRPTPPANPGKATRCPDHYAPLGQRADVITFLKPCRCASF